MTNISLYQRFELSNISIKVLFTTLLLSSVVAHSSVQAQSNSKSKIGNSANSEIYRYTQNGGVVYGDKIPNVSNVKVESISKKTGITLETKRYSEEEIEDQNRIKNEALARKIIQEKEDVLNKELLSKYSSLKDIDDRKKYELSKISEVIQKDITSQVTLEEQKATIDREMNRNPDNKKRLEIEYRTIEKDLEKIKANLELNKGIYFDRGSNFDKDKERYIKILENAKQNK